MTNKLFYSRAEASTMLGISCVTLDRAVKKNLVQCRRLGRRVLFELASLQQFAASVGTDMQAQN
ncbi:MAG: hypothetical protein ABSF66_00825 [Terriglobales bacterium]|jgi:hypothetical protein